MAEEKTTKKARKAEKKKFLAVSIPILNKEIELFASSVEDLHNRDVKLDLTRELRGKSLELSLSINVENNKAVALPKKIELLGFFIRRMIRTGTDYVEDSFSTECKDKKIRIKTFFITRRKVSRAVRKALKEKSKSELISYAKEKNFDEIISDIIDNIVQKELSMKLKKVYPLALCEIRFLGIEK